jgi:hypothetical protein
MDRAINRSNRKLHASRFIRIEGLQDQMNRRTIDNLQQLIDRP